jgi:hypothetical protein
MGLGRLGHCLRPQCFLEVAATTSQGWDGGAACVLQQGSRGFTGLFGLSRASLGLVCSDSSVRSSAVEVGPSCAAEALLFRVPAMSCTSIVQVSRQ